ncbi:MAG TPA: alpha/beta hydrolase [Candidatus Baltobacteraceae bacterium]
MTFTNGDATLGFHIIGQGSPIIFLTGGPGFSAQYLDEVVPYLYGVSGIMLDQRGTGASASISLTQQTMTIANCVSDIEALRQTLGFDSLTLFGHSFGGFMAMAYANAHPANVRALLLIDSAPPDLALEQTMEPLRLARLSAAQRAQVIALRAAPAADPAEAVRAQMRAMLPAFFADPANIDSFERHIDSPDEYVPAVSVALTPDLIANSRLGSLRGLRVPTLVLFGDQDPGHLIALHALQAWFTSPTLVTIPGAGHYPWIEQPKAFYDAVRVFLTAQGLVAPER